MELLIQSPYVKSQREKKAVVIAAQKGAANTAKSDLTLGLQRGHAKVSVKRVSMRTGSPVNAESAKRA